MARIKFEGKLLVYNTRGQVAELPNRDSKIATKFETVEDFIKRGGTVRRPQDDNLVILRKGAARKGAASHQPVVGGGGIVDQTELQRLEKMRSLNSNTGISKTVQANSDYIDTVR